MAIEKGKVAPLHTKLVFHVVDVKLDSFLISEVDGDACSSSCPRSVLFLETPFPGSH
jgi:hypothetical protein